MKHAPITINQALEYEVHSRAWMGWVSWGWLRKVLCRYIVWKLKRKYRNYAASIEFERKMRILNPEMFQ